MGGGNGIITWQWPPSVMMNNWLLSSFIIKTTLKYFSAVQQAWCLSVMCGYDIRSSTFMQTPGFVWTGPIKVIQTVQLVPIWLLWNTVLYKILITNQVETSDVTPSSHAVKFVWNFLKLVFGSSQVPKGIYVCKPAHHHNSERSHSLGHHG